MVEIGLVAIPVSPSHCERQLLRTLSHKIGWLEINPDWLDEIDIRRLRSGFHGKLIYSLRRGKTPAKNGQHLARVRAAAATFDLIELEPDQDGFFELLHFVPPEKRMISWSGTARTVNSLQRRFDQIARYPAQFYKLVTTTAQASDALVPLALLKSLGRSDVVAYGDGAAGFWSRLVAPQFGSPLVYAPIEKSPSELSVADLIADYGFPVVLSADRLYGIVGNPVLQSLSPQLHNAAYRSLGFPGLFIPFHVDCFRDFWKNLVQGHGLESLGIPLCGLTIVSPFKETALKLATACSPMVRHAGSANIFIRTGDSWRADTTDPESIMHTTQERGVPISPKKAAVIGCGGAGRAVAAALHQAGADVTLVNRGKERARFAGELLNLPFVSLSQFSTAGFSVLVNATPVGRDDTRLPIEISCLDSGAIVVDLAYGQHPTPLVTEAAAHGYTVISGYDVLMAQVRRQFKIMVGREMPDIPRKKDDRCAQGSNGGIAVDTDEHVMVKEKFNATA